MWKKQHSLGAARWFRAIAGCCGAVLLLALGLRGQSVQVQTWTTEEGLPQNSVHAVLQSSDGYLWLATENGVARFNGQRFARFSSDNEPAFASNDACCLVERPDGSLLIGTGSGVVLKKDGAFRRLRGIDNPVLGMERDATGSVFVLTADALLVLRGDEVKPVQFPQGLLPTTIGPGAAGSVIVAAGTAVFRVTGGGLLPIGTSPRIPSVLVEDFEGRTWLGAAGEVFVFGSSQPTRHWTLGHDLPGSRVDMLQPWPGGILVGTNRGAALLPLRGGSPEKLTALENNAVLSATRDREGDAWFGTDSGGLFVLRQRSIDTAPSLAGESIAALAAASDGTVWAGTRDAGLRHLRGRSLLPLPLASRLSSQFVLALAPDTSGGVWVGTPEGLDHLSRGRIEHRTAADGLPDDLVRSLLALPNGDVWVGTRRGVAELHEGSIREVLTVGNGLPSDVIGAMLQDRDGSLWIGTMQGLVHRVNGRLEIIRAAGRVNVAVTALLQTADGLLWAGTEQGLFVVRQSQLEPIAAPFLGSGIVGLTEDRAGSVWLRTPGGIVRGSLAALLRCAGQAACPVALRQYGMADGMPSVDLASVGHPALTVTKDGEIWFATRRGVAIVQPERAVPTRVPPGVVIEQVELDDQSVPFRPDIQISPSQRRLSVSFVGLSLRAPAQVRYRYLLEGFDGDWSPWNTANIAEYTNLPTGSYVLHVQAQNADGAVSATDATVLVQVHAPFYRRGWFYLLLLLAAGGIVYGLYWLRLRRVRRNYEAVLKERNRIAREIHDTLAQDFVAVSLQLEVTSQLLQVGATAAAHEQVDATRTLVRHGIQDARESIWAIRAGDSAETLPARLAAVVERSDNATLLVTGAYRALSSSREQEIFRIAKEALGNAVRHARAAHIAVELLYSEDAVVLRVSDDGAGFDVPSGMSKTGHYGLNGMWERAAAIDAALSVQSTPGQGSCVQVTLRTVSGKGA